jgi:dipeptidyl aminopeptidase/acylaminoacyl peptidase
VKYLLLFLFFLTTYSHSQNINLDLINQLSNRSEVQDAQISPSGQFLALAVIRENKRVISVLDLAINKFVSHVKMPRDNEFGDFFWANEERIVAKVNINHSWKESPSYYGELFAFNYDGSKGKTIYGYRTGKLQTGTSIKQRQSTYGWAEIIDPLLTDPKHILISSTLNTKKGIRNSLVLKLDIYKGVTKKTIAKSPISYASFLSKADGSLGLAMGVDEETQQHIFLYNKDKSWTELMLNDENAIPVAFDQSGDNIYLLSASDQDKQGLYKLNIKSGKQKVIFTDKKVDVSSVLKSVKNKQIYALKLNDGLPEYVLINKKHEEAKLFKQLLATFPKSELSILNHTQQGDKFVIKVSSDINPGHIYLYDTEKKQLTFLYAFRAKLDQKKLVKTESFQFESSDKLTIKGYFTPANSYASDHKKKLIVLVHGGPHYVRDFWSFDDEVHVLSQHGYSVIRVNYRGSAGYGTNFAESGYQQWGGNIQQDIAEAVNWAIDNKGISQEKVCIMGHSFGGYAAVMNPINYPDKYQCAIASMGVYDLPLMYEKGDITKISFGESYLNKVLGTNIDIHKQMSPSYNTDKFNIPLLMFHGSKDKRAPIEQAETLTDALDEADKPYQLHLFDKEGHGFFLPENRVKFFKMSLNFLNKHLGE